MTTPEVNQFSVYYHHGNSNRSTVVRTQNIRWTTIPVKNAPNTVHPRGQPAQYDRSQATKTVKTTSTMASPMNRY